MPTARENFKLGFIKQCAAEGLDEAQILDRVGKLVARLEKGASLSDLIQGGYNALSSPGGDSLIPVAMAGGLFAPLAAGGAAGYYGRKLQGDYTDPEDVKKKELIDTYRSLAKKVRRAEASSLGLS